MQIQRENVCKPYCMVIASSFIQKYLLILYYVWDTVLGI